MKIDVSGTRELASKVAITASGLVFAGCLMHPQMTTHGAFICAGVALARVATVLYFDAADEKREKGR